MGDYDVVNDVVDASTNSGLTLDFTSTTDGGITLNTTPVLNGDITIDPDMLNMLTAIDDKLAWLNNLLYFALVVAGAFVFIYFLYRVLKIFIE